MTAVTSYLDKHCPVCVLQLWSWSVWPNVTLDNVDKSIAEWMVRWMDGRVDGWSGGWTKYFTVSESVIMVEKLCSSWIWTVDTFTAVALVSEPLQHRLFHRAPGHSLFLSGRVCPAAGFLHRPLSVLLQNSAADAVVTWYQPGVCHFLMLFSLEFCRGPGDFVRLCSVIILVLCLKQAGSVSQEQTFTKTK